jgi:hypothetical protein
MVVEKVNIAGVAALETENHSPVPAFKEPLQSSMLEIFTQLYRSNMVTSATCQVF